MRLADPPGDQLGVLGAEVDDEDRVEVPAATERGYQRVVFGQREADRPEQVDRAASRRISGAYPKPAITAPISITAIPTRRSGSEAVRRPPRPARTTPTIPIQPVSREIREACSVLARRTNPPATSGRPSTAWAT